MTCFLLSHLSGLKLSFRHYYKNGIIYQDDYTTSYKEFSLLKNEYIDFYNEKMNSS